MRYRNMVGVGGLLLSGIVMITTSGQGRAVQGDTVQAIGAGLPAPAAIAPLAEPAGPAPPPATTTTARPPSTTTTEPPRQRLVVSAAGDTNVDPSYIPAFATEGYGLALSGLGDLFLDDDLTIVNLECAASDVGRRVPKQFNFNCDTAALPVLRDGGVEVANLANNHAGDYGPEALLDTRANVEAAGLAPVGVGADAAEAARPALFEIKGWTVAVVGFGGVVPSADWLAGADHAGMADGDDVASMVATVEAADRLADLVFVTIHWGVELDTAPRPDDVERAHAMIDAGADAVFGHHPHRLQPLVTYHDRPIAWSLGNFVWPRLSAAGARTAVAQVVVEPDGSIRSCLVPVDIERDGHPVTQVQPTGPCQGEGLVDASTGVPSD